MVATDIAARGIDDKYIACHQLRYAGNDRRYTHRAGRTGRASRTGEALTFVTGQDIDLVHSRREPLGDKLAYHNVAGLTIAMPSDQTALAAAVAVRNMKMRNGNGRSYSPKPQAGRTFSRRSSNLQAVHA